MPAVGDNVGALQILGDFTWSSLYISLVVFCPPRRSVVGADKD